MSDDFGQTAVLMEPAAAETDLSRRIEKAIQKDPLDRVKCARVYGDFYRCNWWNQSSPELATKDTSAWSVIAMQRVRKSRFLKVTVVAGKLVIDEML